MTLDELYKIIEDRKNKMPEGSYVASLFKEGKDRIIQKVGEETTEVIIAAKNEIRERIISEAADLIFHLLILLANYDISPKEILKKLEKRGRLAEQKESSYDRECEFVMKKPPFGGAHNNLSTAKSNILKKGREVK